MSEDNVKPSVIPSIYELEETIRKRGLTEKDMIILIQRRTGPQVTRNAIRKTLKAARELEKQLKGAESDE